MSKNTISIGQLEIMCRHVNELVGSGMSENLAIRLLELATDVYAKIRILGNANPYHADQIELWSKAARNAKIANPQLKYGRFLRVEHGTPRRQFARLVLEAYNRGGLSKSWMDAHCDSKWRVAVITHDEDARLSRSKAFSTPEERWRAAGIEF